jgi:hypothetical protein
LDSGILNVSRSAASDFCDRRHLFLAAMVGLYASLRVTQDQIAARTDGRIVIEDSPITRIASAWPSPESGRAAALRELAKIATYAPIISGVPTSAADRSDVNAAPEGNSQASLNDAPAQDATGSIGIAVQLETGAVNQTDHPDIQGNIGEAPEIGNVTAGAEKPERRAAKKVLRASKKKYAKAIQRRRKIARSLEYVVDPTTTGYPLYLTVPVTN